MIILKNGIIVSLNRQEYESLLITPETVCENKKETTGKV